MPLSEHHFEKECLFNLKNSLLVSEKSIFVERRLASKKRKKKSEDDPGFAAFFKMIIFFVASPSPTSIITRMKRIAYEVNDCVLEIPIDQDSNQSLNMETLVLSPGLKVNRFPLFLVKDNLI